MTVEQVSDILLEQGKNVGWYAFVEGFEFPDEMSDRPDANILSERYCIRPNKMSELIDIHYYDGLVLGWEKAEKTSLPIPKFVMEEKSRYFDNI